MDWNKRKYNKKEIEAIIDLYSNGEPIYKIAKRFNCTHNSLKQLLIDLDMFVLGKNSNKKEFTIIEKELIKKFYLNDKMGLERIGKIFNISKDPIQRILKELGILRKCFKNRKKINLTKEQQKLIPYLYWNDNKSANDIAKLMNLTESFVSGFLAKTCGRRSKEVAVSLAKKGVKLQQETKEKIRKKCLEYSIKNPKQIIYGTCKIYNINGLQCQGSYEKFYIEYLINNNKILPSNSESIETPYGLYYPDFTFSNKLIEIKSDYTYDVLKGNRPYRSGGKINMIQYKKIKWVNENIKPIQIIIVDKRNNKLIKKSL